MISIKVIPVDGEKWDEFNAEPAAHLLGDSGLLWAREWLLWTSMAFEVDGQDILKECLPPLFSLVALAIDLPRINEELKQLKVAEWQGGHDSLVLQFAPQNQEIVRITASSSSGSEMCGEAEASRRELWEASVDLIRSINAELASKARGEHRTILESWLMRWSPWWPTPPDRAQWSTTA